MKLLKQVLTSSLAFVTSLSMTVADARTNKKPFNSIIMQKLEVTSTDSGGTLLFSDSPEYVKNDGILYSDIVEGDCRILFYHLNDSKSNKRLAVVAENVYGKFNTIDISRGALSGPSDDFLFVGKKLQTQYMSQPFHSSLYMLKDDKKLLVNDISSKLIKPGQLIYGVYDFYAAHPVKISVLMYPKSADPLQFISKANVLPKDEHRLRGTFKGMNRTLTASKTYNPKTDGVMYIKICDNTIDVFKYGIDATDGSEVLNFGNYGVNYTINLETTDNTRICLTPLGGSYAGAMRAKYNNQYTVIQTPLRSTSFGNKKYKEPESIRKARAEGLSILTKYTELAELGVYSGAFSFEYSPPGASNLPVNIVLMPAE